MQKNGDLFRQTQILQKELNKVKEINLQQSSEIQSYKGSIKEYEKNMKNMHKTSLKNNQISIERYEDLSHQHSRLQEEYQTQNNDLSTLESRNKELEQESMAMKTNQENIVRYKVPNFISFKNCELN